MTRPAAHPHRSVVLAALMVVVVTAACGAAPASAPTTAPSTAPSTVPTLPPPTTAPGPATTFPRPPVRPTTTTTPEPVSPQPTVEEAADAMISGWASGSRPYALSVATVGAVATLFAVPYPPGQAIPRGCSAAFPPIICTFGPPGGGPVDAAVFELSMTQTPKGWYVQSVSVES